MVGHPERLRDLVDEAREKAESKKSGPLREVWDGLMTCFRMLAAYGRGEYRQVPVKTLVAIAGAVIYFMMPLDVIPDFILGVGLADDAALIAWTVKSIKADVERFAAWEKTAAVTDDADASRFASGAARQR